MSEELNAFTVIALVSKASLPAGSAVSHMLRKVQIE
jgi:hypothetical protein